MTRKFQFIGIYPKKIIMNAGKNLVTRMFTYSTVYNKNRKLKYPIIGD